MATIYDVAKLAGVSVGTVSNYLNNRYVGTDRSRRIRDAIESLHYVPNHIARSLKSGSAETTLVLLLPNLIEGIFCELAETIIHDMSQNGYTVILEFSNNSPSEEHKILNKCFAATCAGVLLCTCNPDDTDTFARLQQQKPLVFLLRQPNHLENFCYFGFNNYEIISRLMKALLAQGEHRIGLWTGPTSFSCERACIKAFRDTMASAKIPERNNDVVSLPITREHVFKQATKMFFSGKFPRFILASSRLIADALIEAAYYQNLIVNQNVCILSLGDGKWNNVDQLYFSFSTDRSVKGLAQEACQFMLECLAMPESHDFRIRQYEDDFSSFRLKLILEALQRPIPIKHITASSEFLRIVSPDTDTGVLSIQQLLPWISESTGIKIELDLVQVYDIPQLVMDSKNHSRYDYDLFHLDNSWMAQMSEMRAIRDITDYYQSRPILRSAMVPNLIENTAMVNGRIYGVPSLLCSQMMFYRKDLFENPVLQSNFYKCYKRPLKPPTNWFEYLLTAEFFTKKMNPASPCEYGVIMGTRDPEMMLTEVFPRMWSYGGKVYDQYGNVVLYSEENLQAIRNYVSCIRFSAPEYENLFLPQFPLSFSEGNAAMMIGYDIHACAMMDCSHSKVMDKIGYAPIPGGISTMGGWNYCISVQSDKVEQCYRFMDYLLSPELAIPYTLLGGGSPRKNIVTRPEVISMYPWMQFTDSTFQKSQQRLVPQSIEYINPTEIETERIIANMVKMSIQTPSKIKEYLLEADQALNKMRVLR